MACNQKPKRRVSLLRRVDDDPVPAVKFPELPPVRDDMAVEEPLRGQAPGASQSLPSVLSASSTSRSRNRNVRGTMKKKTLEQQLATFSPYIAIWELKKSFE